MVQVFLPDPGVPVQARSGSQTNRQTPGPLDMLGLQMKVPTKTYYRSTIRGGQDTNWGSAVGGGKRTRGHGHGLGLVILNI